MLGARFATPAHDGRAARESAFENFIPADHAATLALDESVDLLGKPSLEGGLVGETLFGHDLLGLRGDVPFVLAGFVPADMDEGAGEEVDDLGQNVFHEVEGRLLRVEDVGADPPAVADLDLARGEVAEFGVGGDGGGHVTRHIDFGDEFDSAVCSEGHDSADVVLGEEATIRRFVVVAGLGGLVSDDCAGADGADGGEAGVFFDFDAPALIVGEV